MKNSDFLNILQSRRSQGPKMQKAPAPSEEVLEAAALAARAAPSHNPAFPVRFVVADSREKLADIFEAALGPDADQAMRERARSKALKGECAILVIGPKPSHDTPARMDRENLMTAGGALTNFLNVLWAEGFAAKTVTSREITDPQGLFDPETERLLCFILCGTQAAPAEPRPASPSILSRW